MRNICVLSVTLSSLIAALFLSCHQTPVQPEPNAQIQWSATSVVYDTTIAKKDHSLIFFLASWCGWCKKLKTETLTDPQVIQLINTSFNAVQIDPDADSTVTYHDSPMPCSDFTRAAYGVTGFPTIVACDWQGNEIGRCNGYLEAAGFRQWLNQVLGASLSGSEQFDHARSLSDRPAGLPD